MADMMAMTIDVSAKNFRSMENAADKSLSCPVCGKNFPRGAVDLDRHCSAKTLSHFAASQKITGLFTFKCSCNIYFTSEAHLELHKKTICNDTGPHEKILPVPVNTSAKIGQLPPSSTWKMSSGASTKKSNAKGGKKPRGLGEDVDELETEIGQKRGIDDGPESHGVGKRMRIVDPLDRKAFFAIVSLLIPPDAGGKTKITTHNFEDFVPRTHVTLVNKLKDKLNWSA